MEEFIEILRNVFFDISCVGLIACGVALFLFKALPNVWETFCKAFGRNKISRCVFILFAVGAIMYGGTKNDGPTGVSKFIFDKYISDNGSYSTNDTVVIKWKQTIENALPLDTPVYIEYKLAGSTNDWEALASSAQNLGNYEWNGSLVGATNYNYNIYCYYIPPAPVHTNGVWTYNTLKDTQNKNILPLRAEVRDGGSVIATPKSKWDNAPKTARDYVQDGLVAMWDGIENAGWGVHDPNATNWVDIVGGKMLTLSGNLKQLCADNTFSVYIDNVKREVTVRCDWEDNALLSTNNCEEMYGKVYSAHSYDALLRVSCFVGDPLYEVLSNQYCTIEAGFSGGPGSGRWYTPVGWVYYGFRDFGITPSVIVTPVTLYHDGRKYFVSETFQDGKVTVLVNNTKSSTTTISPCSAQDIQGFFMGGTRYSPITHNRTYCLRIYNRPLTADEVAHNYAIDKARFGSGNE